MRVVRVVVLSLLVAVAVVGAISIGPASAAPVIEGSGASFVQLQMEQWRSDVAKPPYNITVNYVASRSTSGRTQFVSSLVDFAVSDIPFQPDELAQASGRPYTYVTLSASGVGFMYNLRDASGKRIGFSASAGGTGTDLKLNPTNLCRIFSEPGLKWNDPAIQAENPDIALPDRAVKPILRQDSAGTSYVTMEYCIATAPDVWAKFVDYVKGTPALATLFSGDPFLEGKPSSRWPPFAGESAFASDGVANVVANGVQGANAITYAEAGFAEVRNFPNALIRNAAGVYQYPESFNVNRALAYASRNADASVTLQYLANDPDAYFPASYSYAIVPTTGLSADKATALGMFLNYAVTKGQEKADALGYAPLSCEITEFSLTEIQRIPGAPPRPQTPCGPPSAMAIGVCYVGTLNTAATRGRFTYLSSSDVSQSGLTQNSITATAAGVPFERLVGDSQTHESLVFYELPSSLSFQDRIVWTIAGHGAANNAFGPISAMLEPRGTLITAANRCSTDPNEPPLPVAEGPLVIATLGVVAFLAAVGIRRATIKLTATH